MNEALALTIMIAVFATLITWAWRCDDESELADIGQADIKPSPEDAARSAQL